MKALFADNQYIK